MSTQVGQSPRNIAGERNLHTHTHTMQYPKHHLHRPYTL